MINKTGLHNDIDYVLVDQETLQRRVHELAEKLTNDYRGKNPVFLCILKGSVHFSAILFANSMIIARLIFSQFQVTAMQEKLPE